MKKKILVIILFIVILGLIFFINNSEANSEKNTLFIGNSKTYYNNLPQKVQRLSTLDGSTTIPDLSCKLVTKGGKGLKWFYENREGFKSTLLEKKWDYIVLQETRSTAIDYSKIDDFKSGAKNLLQYLKDNNVIDENTVIIYNAAWVNAKDGSKIYDLNKLKEDQNKTNQNYRIVKDYIEQEMNIKGKIAYTGNNYISCLENTDMKIGDLYRTDEDAATHPTNAGSYLAACTIYETIFDTKLQDYAGEGVANPYDNVLDNQYKGSVSSADSGSTGVVEKEFRENIQYITRIFTDITAPEVTDIKVSNDQWTNEDVIISFKAIDNIYRTTINGEELQSENENYSYTATSNGDYNIEIMDLVGRTVSTTKNISNIDKELPMLIAIPEVVSNTITVKTDVVDSKSGVNANSYKYYIKEENGTYGTANNGGESYTFTNLKSKTKYIVKVEVSDNAGNIATKEVEIVTGEESKVESTKYKVDEENSIIKGINPKTTATEIKLYLESQNGLEIIDLEGNIVTNTATVGTGYKVKTPEGKEYKIIVWGDFTGDGKIGVAELAIASRVAAQAQEIGQEETFVLDISGDGKVKITDLAAISRLATQ